MEKITGKEGKGAQGSGFTGNTGSNSYSQLPPSSNTAFGIDEAIAAGTAEIDGEVADGESSFAAFGIDASITDGTVPDRRVDDFAGPKGHRGDFGVSAKSGGHAQVNPDSMYGSGARKEGTAQGPGNPGRSGSMGLAIKGLSGTTGGGDISIPGGAPALGAPNAKSRRAAEKGLKGSAADNQ